LLLGCSSAALAHAQPDERKLQCAAAHADGQRLRQDGKITAAKESFGRCAAADCPDVVRADCEGWSKELSRAVPTIVLVATRGEDDESDVRVWVDGVPVRERLDGRPVPVDPGEHVVRFESSRGETVERRVVVQEGEQGRRVIAALAPLSATHGPTAPAPAQSAEGTREAGRRAHSHPAVAWTLVGMSAVALGSFAYFAVDGRVRQAELESGCAPRCTQSDYDKMHTAYIAADVSLVASVLLGGGAAAVWIWGR
jgi:hypothetical protein